MTTEKVAILGAGTMGHSIALSAAWAGLDVQVWGNHEDDIARGRAGIAEKLDVLLAYDAITEAMRQTILERVHLTLSVEECVAGATFVIEAIPEILTLKQEWFERLDALCPSDVILASNTSGLSATEIAARTKHPERTVVTHFWNPGHLIPLVEVVRGEQTAEDTVERALGLLRAMKKKPIVVNKNVLGLVGNRLQFALFREAQYLLEQGVASIEDIDTAVRYSIGRRLPVTGPFLSADMGGLDVYDSISSYLFPDLSTEQATMPTMRELVAEGKYGQKSGAGFYDWTSELSQKMNQARERELIEWLKKDREQE